MTVAHAPLEERHGLSDAELELIEDVLGRVPNAVELGMFGAMWSEHCAYKQCGGRYTAPPADLERRHG